MVTTKIATFLLKIKTKVLLPPLIIYFCQKVASVCFDFQFSAHPTPKKKHTLGAVIPQNTRWDFKILLLVAKFWRNI